MWPVLVGKEFASRLQGKLTYLVLTLLVTLFTGLVLAAFWLIVVNVPTIVPVIGSSVGSNTSVTVQSVVASNRGVFLYYTLAICLLSAVFAVAPAVAGSALSSERENGTLDLLVISGLPARAIIAGKLLAAVVFVLLLGSTTVPGFAVAWMFGGVALRDVGLSLAILGVTLAFICSAGLLISAVARSSTLAALYTYGLVYLLTVGSLLGYLIGASLQSETLVRPLLSLNPFVALLTVPEFVGSTVQQTLPFQYRPAFDPTVYEWLGISLRYPRWINTIAIYSLGTLLLAALAGFLIDPCHRWRTRFDRGRA